MTFSTLIKNTGGGKSDTKWGHPAVQCLYLLLLSVRKYSHYVVRDSSNSGGSLIACQDLRDDPIDRRRLRRSVAEPEAAEEVQRRRQMQMCAAHSIPQARFVSHITVRRKEGRSHLVRPRTALLPNL